MYSRGSCVQGVHNAQGFACHRCSPLILLMIKYLNILKTALGDSPSLKRPKKWTGKSQSSKREATWTVILT